MEDFCIGYRCKEPPLWDVIAVACVCLEEAEWIDAEQQLQEYDSMFDSNSDSHNTERDPHNLRRYWFF